MERVTVEASCPLCGDEIVVVAAPTAVAYGCKSWEVVETITACAHFEGSCMRLAPTILEMFSPVHAAVGKVIMGEI